MAKRRERVRTSPNAGSPPKPEFSRPADVTRIGRLEYRLDISATDDERAALARRFGLIDLATLSAALVLKKRGDGVIEMTGTYRARLAQPCVVTLDPVWATIEDEVRLFYAGTLKKPPVDIDPLDDDGWPEPIVGGIIDAGESVAQLMALALDPYPRSDGAESGKPG